ncbi:MAG: caspase family protein [Magnetococcus sp. YQC-5]
MAKKALLVGINQYAHINPLGGCVNDVKDMANTLTALNVIQPRPGDLRILTDGNATRAKILDGLKWLVGGAKKGDLLIFHYSGHGSYVVDTNGEEVDGKDETICPQDMRVDSDMITDDTLAELFKTINPNEITLEVFLDSCHSGTATRGLRDGGENTTSIRSITPSLDYSFFADAKPGLVSRKLFHHRTSRTSVLVPKMNHILWAGCKSDQTSGENVIGGVRRGYFTYSLCKCLRGTGVKVVRTKLESQVSIYVKNLSNSSQTPQLECDATNMGQPIFT